MKPTNRRLGFTLIEMMVVITIIVLLVTMLVPSLSAARTAARVAHTSALIYALDAGVQAFKADEALGREYPPSNWLTRDNGDPYAGKLGGDYLAEGAQTLVWAILGADQLGTPGFQQSLNTLYALDSTTKSPIRLRRGPFVDLSDVDIKAVRETIIGDNITESSFNSNVPVFVDTFNMPILYYRDNSWNNDYNHGDNRRLATAATGDFPLGLPGTYDPNIISNPPGFRDFIVDTRRADLSPVAGPHKWGLFILISAGPDRLYGTQDDILNFKRR